MRRSARSWRPRQKALVALVAACFAIPEVHANPTGAQVASGQASFSTQGQVLSITNSPGAVINWQGFSIGAAETTRFIQQSVTSSVLNRVVTADPSVILGTLQSNGRVYLINTAGILVGAGAKLDVGAFVGSTLNLSNADFAAGKHNFQAQPGAGNVVNQGNITTPVGGYVYLVATNVANEGVIRTPQGETILAAGNSVRLIDSASPGVSVEVTAGSNKAENLGSIIAESGRVGIVGAVVRNKGVINANQLVRGADGRIFLKATRTVAIEPGSRISAEGERGGRIEVSAHSGDVTVEANSAVTAIGSAGTGGSIQLQSAQGNLVLEQGAVVNASGVTGGSVTLSAAQGQLLLAGAIAASAQRAGQTPAAALTPYVTVNASRAAATPSGDAIETVLLAGINNESATAGVAGQGGSVQLAGYVVNVPTALIDVTGDAGGRISVNSLGDLVIGDGATVNAGGGKGGQVYIESAAGKSLVSSNILVNGDTDRGGLVRLLGEKVALLGRARVDARGRTGGGEVLVGGDYQGGNPNVRNAAATYVGAQAEIDASAMQEGDGGKVIVWADESVRAHGSINANGGISGGNGGFIETSAHHLEVAGIRIGASAPNGSSGNWLLDPINVSITSSADAGGSLAGTAPSIWTPSLPGSTITSTTIQSALNAGTSVTITTTGALAEAGDINVSADIAKTAGTAATLTLKAANNITVATGVGISSTVGALNVVLNADADASGAGAIVLNTGSSIVSNGGNITLGGGSGPISAGVGFARGYSAAGYYNGVTVLGNLAAAGGNIVINGIADPAINAANQSGILIAGSSLSTTGAGNITLTGQSMNANPLYASWGVAIGNGTSASVSSTDGAIQINGTAGSGFSSIGTLVFGGSTVQATGAGKITLNGTVGNSAAAIDTTIGVDIQLSSVVRTNSGILTLNGVNTSTAGSAGSIYGVDINGQNYAPPGGDSKVESTSGAVRIIGSAVNGVGTGVIVFSPVVANKIGNGTSGDILIRSLNGTGITLDTVAIETTGNLTLNAVGGGAITQTGGLITAAGLRVLGDTSATASLTSPGNHVATLAGNLSGATASLSYTDSGSFGIGSSTTYDGSSNTTNSGLSVANGALSSGGGNITVGSGKTLNINGGTLTLSNLTNNGTLSGAGTINVGAGAGTLVNNGIVAPGFANGDSTSTLALAGNLVMGATGSLNLDIHAPVAGSYDVLSVTGTANLNTGTLNLSGVGAVSSYPVLSAGGGVIGAFGTTNAGTFTLSNTLYNANEVTLAVGANTAAAIYWTGGATGDWGTASNWSGGVAPTAATNVYVGNGVTATVLTGGKLGKALVSDGTLSITGGDLSLTEASMVNVLNLSGGTLQGSGNVTLTGAGSWTGGTLTGTGTLTVAGGATLGISGVSNKSFGTRTLANNGTVNWSAGQMVVVGNGAITNSGLFDIQSDVLWGNTNTGNSGSINTNTTTFTNSLGGTFRKSAGAGAATLGSVYTGFGGAGSIGNFSLANNGGALEIQSGSINLNLGSSTLGAALSVTGSGTLGITNGALNTGANDLTVGKLTLSAGSLTGTGNLSVTNDFNFTGGALGGTFNDLSLTKAGAFSIGNLAVLSATGNINLTAVGGDLTLTGSGISKTAGADGTATLRASGHVNINANITAAGVGTGKLDMVFNANTDASGTEATNLTTTTLNANGGAISVGGAFGLAAGTATINSAMTLNGGGTWSGGTLTGTGSLTVGSGATLSLSGGNKFVGTLSFTNNGTVNWSAGQVVVVGNNTFTNNGLFDIQGDVLWGNTNTGNSGTINTNTTTFTNSVGGTVRKSAGAGVATLGSVYTGFGGAGSVGNFNFANSGAMDIQSGSVNLNLSSVPTLINSGTIDISSGATLQRTGAFTNTGTLRGTGTINIGAVNTLTNNGTISPAGNGAAGTLSITGNLALGSAGTLAVNLGGTVAGQSDKLAVSGNLTIDGSLNASTINNYFANNADFIPFLTMTGTRSGVFSTVNAPPGFSAGYGLAANEAARLIYAGSSSAFTNASGGMNWEAPGNWSGLALPGSSDNVLITAGYAVTHASGSDTIRSLAINSGNSLEVSGGSLTVLGSASLGGVLSASGSGAMTLGGALNGAATGRVDVSGGTLTLNGASTVKTLNLASGMLNGTGSVTVSNSFNSTGGAIGGSYSSVALNQASGNLVVPALSAANAITLTTAAGDVVLNGAQSTTAAASKIVVSSSSGFVNNVGAGALSAGSGGRWLVYAANPTSVAKNGLTSGFRHYNATSTTYAPGSVIESGNGFIYASAAGNLSVITNLAAGSASSIYGDTPGAFWSYALSGFADSEDNATNIGLGGAAVFNAPNATTAPGTRNVSYTSGLTSSAGFGFTAGSGYAYDIAQRPLNITANAQGKNYGAADPTLSYQVGATVPGSGLVNGDSLGGSLTRAPGENVAGGPYAIGLGTLSAGGNYTLAYTGNNFTINPYTVNLTGSRTYDGTANIAAGALMIGPLIGSETLALSGTGAMVDKHVGVAKQVALGTLTLVDGANGGLASNYTFAGGSQTASITKANLTLGTATVTRTYDGGVAAAGTATVTGGILFSGDMLSGGSFAFTDRNVGAGNKTVTVGSVTINDGNNGGNYNVSYANNTASTINQLSSVAWTGANGAWSNPANWAGGAIPDGANVAAVTIPSGKTVTYDSGVAGTTTLNSLTSSGTLVMNGGMLSLGGTSSLSALNMTGGALNVTAGTISLANVTVTSLGTLGLSGTGVLNMEGPWSNAGIFSIAAGTLNLGGTFATGGLGTFVRSGGTVNLTGTLDNSGGTLDLGSSGRFGAGGLNAVSGTIRNGTIMSTDATPTLNIAGTLDGVTLGSNLNTSGNVYIANGLTLGNGVAVNKGGSDWYFDGLNNGGKPAGTVHHLASLGNSTLNSAGGSIVLLSGNAQTLQIDGGVTVQGYGNLTQFSGGNSIINNGAIIANTAGQTFTINPSTFNNAGMVSVSGGTVNVGSSGSDTGTYSVASGAALQFTGGTRNLNAGSDVTGSGAVTFSGGTTNIDGSYAIAATGTTTINGSGTANFNVPLTFANTFTLDGGSARLNGSGNLILNGAFNWSNNADTNGTGTLTTGGVTTISGFGNYANRHWINTGTVNLVSGSNDFEMPPGALVDNQGTFNINSSKANPIASLWGGTATFNNSGTLNWNGSGTQYVDSPIQMINTGNLNVNSGTYRQIGALTQSATIKVASGAAFAKTDGFTNTGTLSGSGSIVVGAGAAKLVNQGNINPGGTDSAGTLSISGDLQLATGSNLNIELGGTSAGQSDKLAVSGSITTGGTLNASLLHGYSPLNADAIPFMTTGGTASGTFSPSNLPASFSAGYNLAAGEAARLIYAGGSAITFTNAVGGLDWSTPGNWNGGLLPGAADAALISGGYAVTHSSGTHSIAELTINSANALNVSGGSLTVSGITTLGGSLSISGTGSASLNGALNGAASGQVSVSGGNLSLGAASSIKTLSMSGGTLNALADLAILGTYNFTGGTLQGAGAITLDGPFNWGANGIIAGAASQPPVTINGVLTVTGAGNSSHQISGRTVVHTNSTGQSSLGGADNVQINIDNGATFRNAAGAVLTVNSAAGEVVYIDNDLGPASFFINQGTLNKTGAGTLSIAPNSALSFNQSGRVNVGAGVLEIGMASTFNAGSRVDLAAGAALRFSTSGFSGTHNIAAAADVTGAGLLEVASSDTVNLGANLGIFASGTTSVSGGQLNVNVPVTIAGALNQSGGVINAASSLTASGAYNFTDGTLQGAGAIALDGQFNWGANGIIAGTTVQPPVTINGVMAVTGAGNSSHQISGRTVVHTNASGQSSLSGADNVQINIDNGASFRNAAGAVLVADSSAGTAFYIDSDVGAASSFINQGTLKKTGAGVLGIAPNILLSFEHSGRMDILGGTVQLGRASTLGSGSRTDVASGAALKFATDAGFAGSHNIAAGADVTGAGLFEVTTNNSVSLDTNLGIFTTGSTAVSGGQMNATVPVTMAGSLNVSGGTLSLAGASSIGRASLTGGTLSAPAGLTVNDYTQTAGTLNVGASTLLKSPGSMTVNGAIAGNTGGTLTLQAVNDIALGAGGAIAGTVAPLNVVLNSNSSGAGGAISLASGTSIAINGGNLTLGGGSNPATGYAVGNATYVSGINIAGSISTAGGGIVAHGQGKANTAGAYGISVNAGSIAATGGNILLSSAAGSGINLTNATLATSGNVTLSSMGGGAITQSGGSIAASGLRVLGDTSATANLLAAANHVTTLAGNLAGGAATLSYADSGTFTIGALITDDIGSGATTTTAGLNLGTASTNALTLTAGGVISANANVGTGVFTLGGGTWNQVASTLPGFAATDFRIAGGTFIRALGGDGSSGNPYQLADIYGVQGIGSAGMFAKTYALAGNVDAATTSTWNAGAGFMPIGNASTAFTGTFDGQSHTIGNLAINRPTTDYVGLFGNAGAGSVIRRAGLTGGSVTGGTFVGGLVGNNLGSISNTYSTASVSSGANEIGGLVGRNLAGGTISNSYAAGNVGGTGQTIGGLLGHNYGTLSNSYATGSVSGVSNAGGLVGQNFGSVSNSYATGAVSIAAGQATIGGLVGWNHNGSIINSYSTGLVAGGSVNVGGLIGANDSSVSNSFWDTTTSGKASSAGGRGLGTAQMKQISSFSNWNTATPNTVANTGGSGAVWRIYEGHTAPLLTSFMTPLTLTDAPDVAVSYNGLARSAATTAITGVLGSAATGTNVGFYNGYYSTQQGYDITGGNLIINPANVNAISLNGTRVYDGTFNVAAGIFTLSGLVNGESLTLTGVGTVADKNVGVDKPVSLGSLALGNGTGLASNYTFAGGIQKATITPANLTLSTANVTKTYDGGFSAAGTAAVTGGVLFSGDSLQGGSFAFTDKNAGIGNKTVTAGGITVNEGNGGSNYNVSYASNTTSTINPYAVNLTGSRVYDGTTDIAAGALTLGRLVGSETLVLSGNGSLSDKNVGVSKAISRGTLTLADGGNGGLASNYTFTGGTQTASITARPLVVTASGVAKVYDGLTGATVSYADNRLPGDVLAASGSASYLDRNVGTGKPVVVSGIALSGADAGNYSFNTTAATHADITVRPLSTWTGGVTGNWSVAANWDALPDLANVLAVSVPSGKTVTYDAAAGTTHLTTLNAAGLNIGGGTLNIASSLTVGSSFSQSGGTLGFGSGATASITQAIGNLNIPALSVANLNLNAPEGAISQTGAIVAGRLVTQSKSGTVLSDAGNNFASFAAVNSGSGDVNVKSSGVALDVAGVVNSGGNVLITSTGAMNTSAGVSAGGMLGLFGSGLSTGGTVAAGSLMTLDANTSMLAIGAPVNGSGAQVNLYGGNMDITAAVNNPGGTVFLKNTSGGAVTLGLGATGTGSSDARFGLSEAELKRINAATLTIKASPATIDGPINLSSTGAPAVMNLEAGSLAVNNNFITSAVLNITTSGDMSVSAGTSPVTLQGSSVNISAANVQVSGGSLANASAGIAASSGNVSINTPLAGTLSFVPGVGGAKVQAAGTITGQVGNCVACTGNLSIGAGETLALLLSTPTDTSAEDAATKAAADAAKAAADAAAAQASKGTSSTTILGGGSSTSGPTSSGTGTGTSGSSGSGSGSIGSDSSSSGSSGNSSSGGGTVVDTSAANTGANLLGSLGTSGVAPTVTLVGGTTGGQTGTFGGSSTTTGPSGSGGGTTGGGTGSGGSSGSDSGSGSSGSASGSDSGSSGGSGESKQADNKQGEKKDDGSKKQDTAKSGGQKDDKPKSAKSLPVCS